MLKPSILFARTSSHPESVASSVRAGAAGPAAEPSRSSHGFIAFCAALLSGCVPSLPQGPPRAPNTVTPDTFRGHADQVNMARADWHEIFQDPQLEALVDEALANNQELNIAVQEMFLARAEVMARRGEILPRFGIGGGAGVERVSGATSQGVNDEDVGLDPILQSYSAALTASWEVDIWGRLRDLGNAAAYRYLATVEGRRFLVTQLVAEIASLYYELMALDQRLEVIERGVANQEQALRATRQQFAAGRVTSLAITRFEAELLEWRAREAETRQRIVETENRLNFLLGRFPEPIERPSERFMDMQPALIATGLPAELLENRPDVRAAELELRAARLDVSAARARFFPALSLEAGLGYSSFDIRRLVETPGSIFFDLFAGLTAPLLNRAGITAEYYGADARQRQAVLRYERAILAAYIEVVNRLNLVRTLAGVYQTRQGRVRRLARAIEISTQLFASARADYLEVLTARRESLDAQLELIEVKQRQLTAAISVYTALGGGWRGGSTSGASGESIANRLASRQAVP